MKFNPSTKRLYTDDNVLIKQLRCPRNVRWELMSDVASRQRHCGFCERNITDIQGLADAEVLAIAQQDKNACFKLELNDENIEVINHHV